MDLSVVLLAYGAAESLDELPAYLRDILGDRPVPPGLLADVTERYRAIGGRSPLLEITRAQAAGLEKRLIRCGLSAKVRVGMRHSSPRIAEAVAEALADAPETLVALPMTPYPSGMSVGAYLKAFDAALTGQASPRVARIEGFHKEPKLIEAFAEKIAAEKPALPAGDATALLLTAHSLPERIVAEGDAYPGALHETARAVAEAAGFSHWRFAYQSKGGGGGAPKRGGGGAQPFSSRAVPEAPKRGGGGEPWLGPDAGEALEELAREGTQAVLLSPIGFISDHMETLYDDDVLYRRRAEELGLRFARAAALNDSPLFLDALASVVRAAAVS